MERVLWLSTKRSPWYKESRAAYDLLNKAGLTFYVMETTGLAGPELKQGEVTYAGLEEIRQLVNRIGPI